MGFDPAPQQRGIVCYRGWKRSEAVVCDRQNRHLRCTVKITCDTTCSKRLAEQSTAIGMGYLMQRCLCGPISSRGERAHHGGLQLINRYARQIRQRLQLERCLCGVHGCFTRRARILKACESHTFTAHDPRDPRRTCRCGAPVCSLAPAIPGFQRGCD